MITHDQELEVTLERIRRFQIAHLARVTVQLEDVGALDLAQQRPRVSLVNAQHRIDDAARVIAE